MGDSPQLEIEIVMPDGSITKAFGKMKTEAQRAGSESGEKYGQKFSENTEKAISTSTVFKGAFFANLASGMIRSAANAAKSFASGLVSGGAEMERYNTQLSVLLGSSEKAAKHLTALAKFSASTPFQLPGIVETSKMLLSFGFTQEKVMDSLQKIGDVAAISGNGLKELALVYGQVSAAGKLTGERLLQIQERGIPIVSALAKEMGVAESSIKDMVSSGQIDFKKFEKAFASLSKEGGLFFQGMAKQSETLEGVQSTLNDNISLVQSTIGRAMIPAMKEASKLAIELASDIGKWAAENKDKIEEFSKEVLAGVVVALKDLAKYGKMAFEFFKDHGAAMLTAVAVFKVGEAVLAVKAAVVGLNLAMSANPLGLLALGAAAAVSALGLLVDKGTERSTDSIYKMNRAIIENEKETAKLEKTLGNLMSGQRASGKVDAETGRLHDQVAQKFKESIESKIDALRREREEMQKNLVAMQSAKSNRAPSGEKKEESTGDSGNATDPGQDKDAHVLAWEEYVKSQENASAGLGNLWSSTSANFSTHAKSMVKTAKQMSAEVSSFLISGLANGAGQAFAQFGKSLAQGENGLKAMAESFIGTLGQMSVQMGTMFMAQAAAMFFSPNTVDNAKAPGLLATGAALAALGGAMQAFTAGGGGASGSSAGASSTNMNYENSAEGATSTYAKEEKQEPSTVVNLNVHGNILDSNESGMALVKMINNAIKNNGAKVYA